MKKMTTTTMARAQRKRPRHPPRHPPRRQRAHWPPGSREAARHARRPNDRPSPRAPSSAPNSTAKKRTGAENSGEMRRKIGKRRQKRARKGFHVPPRCHRACLKDGRKRRKTGFNWLPTPTETILSVCSRDAGKMEENERADRNVSTARTATFAATTHRQTNTTTNVRQCQEATTRSPVRPSERAERTGPPVQAGSEQAVERSGGVGGGGAAAAERRRRRRPFRRWPRDLTAAWLCTCL